MMGWLPLLPCLCLRPSAIPTKIVYANAKQSPNERCIVNPLPPSPLPPPPKRSGTSWVHDSRERERQLETSFGATEAQCRPLGLMFVMCMVMVMRFRNDGNFAGAMPRRLPDSVGGGTL